jgi:hypothetical protein
MKERAMVLATFGDFIAHSFFVVVFCVCFYGWLIKKLMANNPDAKKSAGKVAMSLLSKWLR